MTVAATTNRSTPVAGNGATVNFAFGFPYRVSSDLVVISRSSSGVETVKTEGVDYTVAGVSNAGTGGFDSGTVTFTVAPATGTTIVISREVPPTQAVDPVTNAALGAANVEGALDRLTLIAQYLKDTLSRTVKFNRSTPSTTDLPLPDPPAVDGSTYLIAWNAARTAWVSVLSSTLSAGQAVSSFVSGLLTAANAAAFFSTMGVKTGSAVIDFASVADNATSAGSTIAVTGAAVGDYVMLSASGNLMTTAGVFLFGYVTAAGTVTAYCHNDSGGAFDAASQTVFAVVFPKALFGQ
jgi:hypothetical protein